MVAEKLLILKLIFASIYMVAEKLLILKLILNYFREFYKLENYSNYNKPCSLEITPNKLIKSI